MTQTLVVDASNIRGLGARRLTDCLLPAIQAAAGYRRIEVKRPQSTVLPNAVARLLECLRPQSDTQPRLVLGDIPLRCAGFQAVFVQNAHLVPGSESGGLLPAIKHYILRAVFRLNLRFADRLIVQTNQMKDALERAYPTAKGRVTVVAQPVPIGIRRVKRTPWHGGKLRLAYPAAAYPHKNHRLLSQIGKAAASIATTLSGELDLQAMTRMYAAADALVFPSLAESYGFPLVEAMWLGLPIVASDRPYARALCGSGAIYFDPHSPESLSEALVTLRRRLDVGWVPDWRRQLTALPSSWAETAEMMLKAIPLDRQAKGFKVSNDIRSCRAAA